MLLLDSWPELLQTTAVAAAVSLAGFGLKQFYDRWHKRKEARQQAARTLADFQRLLTESDAIAATHFGLRRRLSESIRESPQLEQRRPGETSNDTYARLYDDFSPPQKKLFQLLRGTTANSMRQQNQLLLDWADRHSAFTLFGEGAEEQAFDKQMQLLRAHLRTWRDKFESGFEADPRQSLVYLADEDHHGTAFPKQLSAATKALCAKHPLSK